ncbi:putative peptidoglycan glycosyltransferase FtsW [bioreactor metagenome]|uniref:Putative peptidoglycan glycosyltransferase FtsW n=1 Tax=bioreactor metagenome TaxID=1076179 RepID=A0A644Y7Q4_9ZZZZ
MFNRLRDTLSDFFQQADLVLLGLCCGCTLFGMALIASATHYMGTGSMIRSVGIQGAAMLIGLAAYILLSMVDVELLVKHWKIILAVSVVFILLLRTPLGVTRNGNRAWLEIPHVPFSVQPAEVVKITFIILLSKQFEWIKEQRRELKSFGSVVMPTVHLLFMVGLIYAVSSDMGSALVYVFIFICIALVAGIAWRWFILGGGGMTAAVLALYFLDKLPSHMADRFHVLFDHSFQPQGVGWQQTRGLLALGSGGWFGQGLFNGTQTQAGSGSLPARHTDFIFAMIGEELGFFGCLLVILLLTAIILRCLWVARQASSDYARLVCVGMAGMLIFQTVENIGMCLFVMPVIGLTLPFFSYGGSSVVTLYAAMGIVSGIKKRALMNWNR